MIVGSAVEAGCRTADPAATHGAEAVGFVAGQGVRAPVAELCPDLSDCSASANCIAPTEPVRDGPAGLVGVTPVAGTVQANKARPRTATTPHEARNGRRRARIGE